MPTPSPSPTPIRPPSARWPARLLGLLLLAAGATTPAAQPVGLDFASYVDTQRPSWSSSAGRPIDATFWYPAAAGVPEEEWQVAIFRAGKTSIGAEMAPSPKRFPLVLISHGTGGSSVSMGWLAHALASRGYIVAAVNHHGNTAAEPKLLPQGFALWWERARDLSVLLDRIAVHPRLAGRVDMERVGVAGFSLGGYTALLLAGARTDRARWVDFCRQNSTDTNCVLPPEAHIGLQELVRVIEGDEKSRQSIARAGDSYRDTRIRAAFVLAPVQVPALDPASIAQVRIPVSLVVGDEDRQAPPALNADALARQLPQARLAHVPDGTHYMFLTPCTPLGKLIARAICADPWGLDRREVQREVGRDAARFFDEALGGGDAPRAPRPAARSGS
jgi:predicted dienelactone hydrolase